jgi:hypothetical protein
MSSFERSPFIDSQTTLNNDMSKSRASVNTNDLRDAIEEEFSYGNTPSNSTSTMFPGMFDRKGYMIILSIIIIVILLIVSLYFIVPYIKNGEKFLGWSTRSDLGDYDDEYEGTELERQIDKLMKMQKNNLSINL